MSARFVVADVFDGLATLDDGSVDLVVTSPPFLALRSYLPADHPDKGKEIGSEATPAEFLDVLLRVTAELRRVLAPHGSICVELGDTYAGSGGAGGDYGDQGWRDGQNKFAGSARLAQSPEEHHECACEGTGDGCTGSGAPAILDGTGRRNRPADVAAGILAPTKRPGPGQRDNIAGWPLAKSKTLIPELYRIALAYGINPLTGSESPAGRWRIRNVVTWARPNPPVGCVDDKTEALTPDGWKKHGDLNDGDLIAAYDPATDSCRFMPAKFVRWQRDEELVSIEKRKTSQRLTEDHRCLVRTRKRPEPHVVLAGDLTNSHQTLLAAGLDDAPGPEPVTVERAELLGWFIAEGTPKHRQARIVQSLSANPEKVDRIRALLDADGADYTESRYQRRRPETISGGDVLVTWTIKGELAEWLSLHHKRLPAQYGTTWPTRTLAALFEGLIGGDGHYRKGGGVLFHQKDRSVADSVQIIAIRLGRRASVTWQQSLGLWQVTVGDPEHFAAQRWTKVRKWDGEGIPREVYSGVVWCPQVETTFWLARRNGKTFVTGNSLGDKWRPATSDVVVACVSDKRYWDDIATRREPGEHARRLQQQPTAVSPDAKTTYGTMANDTNQGRPEFNTGANSHGAPLLDYWEIPPGGYPGSHYAVFPPALVEPLIKAMAPPKVCRTCGEPSRRIVENNGYERDGQPVDDLDPWPWGGYETGRRGDRKSNDGGITARMETVGWSDCGHDDWRPALILDPFAGSGTTLSVATGHGHDALGIDLDERNAQLAEERIGPFLFERVA